MKRQISGIQAIIEEKCPRCREGKLFVSSAWNLAKFTETHKYCPVCNARYEREPNFFQGAMYISYAFTIATMVICTILTYLILGYVEPWTYLIIISIALVIASPISFRYARVLMLHWFGGFHYESDILSKTKPSQKGKLVENNFV